MSKRSKTASKVPRWHWEEVKGYPRRPREDQEPPDGYFLDLDDPLSVWQPFAREGGVTMFRRRVTLRAPDGE